MLGLLATSLFLVKISWLVTLLNFFRHFPLSVNFPFMEQDKDISSMD